MADAPSAAARKPAHLFERLQTTRVPITGAVHVCRDRDDDKFLETAISGEADCIITGDTDLLALDPFEGVAIVHASRFP